MVYDLKVRELNIDSSVEVVSLLWNPGEDVFLALLSDSNMLMFT